MTDYELLYSNFKMGVNEEKALRELSDLYKENNDKFNFLIVSENVKEDYEKK